MLTKTSLLACAAVAGLGSVAAWPIKTIDPSADGANCDTSKEQYLQVEAYDFHDHPKITMRWRQISGECGAPVSDPMEWEESYDVGNGDTPPDEGRVQLNIFVCAPFGHYEIDLDVASYSDEGSTLQQRTAWEIENGPDEACSDHCSEYEYFGVEFGRECFCGTETKFKSAVSSNQCGLTYESLCTGDSTAACGGRDAISVYKRGDVDPPAPTPAPITPTPPSPTPPPTDPPTTTSGSTYSSVGCFRDSKRKRIMSNKQTSGHMSAEVCSGLCDNGSNTHFGTQYGAEAITRSAPTSSAKMTAATSGATRTARTTVPWATDSSTPK
eukprot:jgi/Undpi1/5231/HiC_scaffold_2.g00512.m2